MTGTEPLPPSVLERKAVVYVRQSTTAQVQSNQESQRRQYELADVARRHGFRTVEVIPPARVVLERRGSVRIFAGWFI